MKILTPYPFQMELLLKLGIQSKPMVDDSGQYIYQMNKFKALSLSSKFFF
jgi:hypothetical protein